MNNRMGLEKYNAAPHVNDRATADQQYTLGSLFLDHCEAGHRHTARLTSWLKR